MQAVRINTKKSSFSQNELFKYKGDILIFVFDQLCIKVLPVHTGDITD